MIAALVVGQKGLGGDLKRKLIFRFQLHILSSCYLLLLIARKIVAYLTVFTFKKYSLEETRIDAHQHFWYYNSIKHNWITDEMAIIRKDFLPKDLQTIYAKNGIAGCIAVQADQTEAETEFLLTLAEEYNFIKGVVGWVDLCAPNVAQQLAYFSQFPKLKGFRHVVQSEPDPKFMLQETFQYGISCLQQYSFTYDILIFPTQLAAALKLVKNFPKQKFVIDHLAKPYIKKRTLAGWEKYIRALGACDNVWCKVSGMVTEADWKKWQYKDFVPFLEVVFEAFSNERIMFGSDWPVCLVGGSYQNVKGILEQYIHQLPPEKQARIWGKNALDFYNI